MSFFILDLFQTAQSWFETEKQSAETEGATADDSPQETVQPSVPTVGNEDTQCQVCHDAFEQFYNEEKEEWHLRPAVNFEGKNYHPLCLEDFKVNFFFFYFQLNLFHILPVIELIIIKLSSTFWCIIISLWDIKIDRKKKGRDNTSLFGKIIKVL